MLNLSYQMKSNPKISVLMSVYNGEKFISESISSILNQTYKNFEFLIVNDGSTDNSEKIIESFSDSRIIYLSKQNTGLTKSLNQFRGKSVLGRLILNCLKIFMISQNSMQERKKRLRLTSICKMPKEQQEISSFWILHWIDCKT